MLHVLNPETSHSPIPIFFTVGTPVNLYYESISNDADKHTVPQEEQKRPASNSTNDCARKIPLFF